MKTYPYMITLHDENCKKVRAVKFNGSHSEARLRQKAYSMLAEHMRDNIAGMVEISGPVGRIVIYQNSGDFEPTEHRQGIAVQFI